MKTSVLALALASALSFSATLHARGVVAGTIDQVVQPSAGRQSIPLGTQIAGGVDLGEVIAGANLTLPNGQTLLDVLVMQVRRDSAGRVIGGTVSNKWGPLSLAGGASPAPTAAAAATTTPAAVSTAGGVAKGASMTAALSPGMIAAIALGAAVLVGAGGGSSTTSHSQ